MVIETIVTFVFSFGGLFFLVFELKNMSVTMGYLFLMAWFSLLLSATCIAYLVVLPYKDIHILIREKRAELIGEEDE